MSNSEAEPVVGQEFLPKRPARYDGNAPYPETGNLYRHFKGGTYRITGFAYDAGNAAKLALYVDEYLEGPGSGRVWARPEAEFRQTVELADGNWVERFERLEAAL